MSLTGLNLTGLILAGGASSRMGSPKAALVWRGETFLERLEGLFRPYCRQLAVVLGYEGRAVSQGAELIRNPAPERGMLSSLQCGLRAARYGHVLFAPVDYPAVRESTLAAIYGALLAAPWAPLVAPLYQGRRGHPVLLGPALVAELLRLPETAQARQVVRAHAGEAVYAGVDDAGILRDIDTPADYAELLGEGEAS